MERNVVVVAFLDEQLDALDMLRRQIRPQPHNHTPLRRVDDDGVLLVEIGRQLLGERRQAQDEKRRDGENPIMRSPCRCEQ